MKQCPSCDRHLLGGEASCPFCGAAQVCVVAPRGPTTARVTGLGLGLGLSGMVACGPQTGSDTAGASTGATTSSTTVVASTGSSGVVGTTEGTTALDGTSSSDGSDDMPAGFYGGVPDILSDWECDLFAQDCPPGEKCMPWSTNGDEVWDGSRCVQVAPGADGLGESCTVEGSPYSGIDSCDYGTMCWAVDPATNVGECTAFCQGDETSPICDDPGQTCGLLPAGVPLCLDACDPFLQDCAEGFGCYPIQETFVCLPNVGDGIFQSTCETPGDCVPGTTCIDASVFLACPADGCCAPWCDLTEIDTCPNAALGVECLPWFAEGATKIWQDLGVCGIPK